MICLIRTMNPVTLSYAQALLKDAEIESFLFDMNASVMDGSTILVRRRLMIIDEDETCLLYTSPSPRDATLSRMPSSA